MQFLQWLNRYANAFLALLTLVYVALTYRTLKALRRESTREHRLRHLTDIKEKVVQPIGGWISSEAIPVLQGEVFAVSCDVVRIERPGAQFGEKAYEERVELGVRRRKPRMGGHLFEHTRTAHFPKQLNAVRYFLDDFQRLLDDYLREAGQWADTAAGTTHLGRVTTPSVGPSDFADSDFLVAFYIKCMISGNKPELVRRHPTPDTIEVTERASGRLIGRGETAAIRVWIERSWEIVNGGWGEKGFARVNNAALRQAFLVREYVGRLELTYDLGSDCEYVGGQGGWRFWRLLRSKIKGRISGLFCRRGPAGRTGAAGGADIDF